MNTKIEKRIHNDQEMLIEQLKKTPIVQIVCEKTSIGRSTYYRWLEKYPDFAKKANEAIEEGSFLINDLAESQLISAIKDQNLGAIIFWLKSHHPIYAPKVEIDARLKMDKENLTPEQEILVKNALKLAGLLSMPESIKGGRKK